METAALQVEQNAHTEEPPALDEERINRLAWLSTVAAFAMTVAVITVFVALEANQPWKLAVYPILALIPSLFGLVASRYVRITHVELLRRYQARLMMRTVELEKMASHDELTELYNRRHFYEQFQEELARCRSSKQTMALILLDIDSLKKINDEYGHTVGDIMIANLAKVIAKHIRTSDVPARLGGDEFAILMPETDKRGAFALAQRLWQELDETPMYEHEGLQIPLNVSIGVSGYPWGGEDADEMMHWADADMYANKVSRKLPQAAKAHHPDKLREDPRLEDQDWF